MPFQYLTDDHLLHYGRRGWFNIEVECLCGFKVTGRGKDQEVEVAKHVIQAKTGKWLATEEDVR